LNLIIKELKKPKMGNQTKINYTFEGFKINVICCSSHRPWLNEFLLPWLNSSNLVMIERTVILIENDTQFLSLSNQTIKKDSAQENLVGFLLDGSVIMFSLYRDIEGKSWLLDPQFKAFYRIDQEKIEIIVPNNCNEAKFILARVIRELAIAKALDNGVPVLHGSSVGKQNQGILILGDRGAGKTSFSAYCMNRLGFDFIANDRVAVLNDEVGKFQVHGIPTLIRIRRPTSELLPEVNWRRLSRPYSSRHSLSEALSLNEDYYGDVSEHIFLSPAQYHWLLGVKALASVPLRLLLFPCVVPDNQAQDDQLHFERLSTEETYKLLQNNSFSRWLPQGKKRAFVLKENQHPDLVGVDRVLQRMSQEIPAYRCFLTPNVYQDRESLARLLEVV
jgi:hypothetical protein